MSMVRYNFLFYVLGRSDTLLEPMSSAVFLLPIKYALLHCKDINASGGCGGRLVL